MQEKQKSKELLILNVLKNSQKTMSSGRIAEELTSLGHEVSERTIRLYLQQLVSRGLTTSNGKKVTLFPKRSERARFVKNHRKGWFSLGEDRSDVLPNELRP